MGIDYSYLRPGKANALKKWHTVSGFEKRDNLCCECYENAVVLPIYRIENETLQFGHGGVIVGTHYIEKSGIEGRVGGFYSYGTPIVSNDRVVYCGYLIHQWGHFLIEGAARLWAVFEKINEVDAFVFISKLDGTTEISGNYREFFELLGILDKVKVINKPTIFPKVYVPELGYNRKYYFSEEYAHIFDHIAENALKRQFNLPTPHLVYLSRSKFPKAKASEVGLDMLDSFFRNNGFTILYPEQLSLAELIYYLRNAKLCASESGTLAHNYLFAQKQKNCLIIERQTIVNEIQANLDIIKDLNVCYIDGHFMVYPVSAGAGPFFLAFTKEFERFAKDRKMVLPDAVYLKEKYIKSCLRTYMKTYRFYYCYKLGMEDWMVMYAELMQEAYEETLPFLSDFLSGGKPLFINDYLNLKYLIRGLRNIIKKILFPH